MKGVDHMKIKKFLKWYLIVDLIISIVFYTLFLVSKKFRDRYLDWSVKLAGKTMEYVLKSYNNRT